MRNWLLSIDRSYKQVLVAIIDFFLILLSLIFAGIISGLELENITLLEGLKILWIPILSILIFKIFGVYRSLIRYVDFSTIFLVIKCMFLLLFLNIILKLFLDQNLGFNYSSLSIQGWVIFFLSCITLVSAFRISANYFFKNLYPGKKVLIYGAGHAGIQLSAALRLSSEMEPIAFIDDNKSLHNKFIGGIKIFSPLNLDNLINRNGIEEVLVAMPSTTKQILKNLLKKIEIYPVKVRILPGLAELAQGKVLVSELKEVEISDILGRLEVAPNKDLLDKNIRNKTVLITGAGGSIGSELARQVYQLKAKKLILLDSSEFSLYAIKKEIESKSSEVEIHAILANVTNAQRMREIFKAFQIDTIYHAAAYKHVPLVEENPFEGVINNIIGTKVCAEAAVEAHVDTFVLVSTDKAVRPTNIMGATKRFAELILQSLADDDVKTKMTMVRFGNVIGSSGSAIPLFQQQIKEGGPVTVTHPDVIRYFMSIPEASELVIQAGAMAKGGDVFVLDMGEPVKILELAKRLIKLNGMKLKDENDVEGDIEIIFTGLRPGEKLFEELLIGNNVSKTNHKQILRAQETYLSKDKLLQSLVLIKSAEESNDVRALKEILKDIIVGYKAEEEIVDVIYLQKK